MDNNNVNKLINKINTMSKLLNFIKTKYMELICITYVSFILTLLIVIITK